jgi:hypothetical protein
MNMLARFFSFGGRVAPLPYAAWATIIFFLPHAATWGVFSMLHRPLETGLRFWLMPLLSLVQLPQLPSLALLSAFFAMLLCSWALAALSFRRAVSAGLDGWIAALAAAPVLQVPAIVFLSVWPAREQMETPRTPPPERDWVPAAQGVLAGMGLTLFAVAVGALVFGTYGYGIFVLSPFLIGATTAFLANRREALSYRRTMQLVTLALVLGGAALVMAALEGIVCIVLAAPLAWLAAAVGAALGQSAAARASGRRSRSTLMCVALLPLAFASERALPQTTHFATDEQIEIAASPDAVWTALIHMDRFETPPALPFRLGIAYPVRGEIVGEGVGAIRRGVFSTGVAIERVTAWQKDRMLGFVVLSDPPAMREMSPYAHVNAPHVHGYFRTVATTFAIVPLANGRSLVREHTEHELRLDPILYWMPFARWIIHENNARVLDAVREHAERRATASR